MLYMAAMPPDSPELDHQRVNWRKHWRIVAAGFALGIFLMLFKPLRWPNVWTIVFSFAAAVLFGLYVWWAEHAIMGDGDELEQKVRTEALATTYPFTLGLIVLMALLHDAGMLPHGHWVLWPVLPSYWHIVALAWLRRRYR